MIELPMRWPLVIQLTLLSLSRLVCPSLLSQSVCFLLLIHSLHSSFDLKILGHWFIRDFFHSPNCWCLFICTQHPSESIQGKFLKKRLVDPQELQQSDWVRDSCAVSASEFSVMIFPFVLVNHKMHSKGPFVLYSVPVPLLALHLILFLNCSAFGEIVFWSPNELRNP